MNYWVKVDFCNSNAISFQEATSYKLRCHGYLLTANRKDHFLPLRPQQVFHLSSNYLTWIVQTINSLRSMVLAIIKSYDFKKSMSLLCIKENYMKRVSLFDRKSFFLLLQRILFEGPLLIGLSTSIIVVVFSRSLAFNEMASPTKKSKKVRNTFWIFQNKK